jgi:AraC family ethanolamine operon transcriptional activator
LSIELPQKGTSHDSVSKIRSASPPSVTVIDITDPTAIGEDVEVLGQDAVKLETEPLRAKQIIVRLDDSLVLFQSTNLRMRMRTTLQNGLFAYVVFGPQAKGTLNGLPVGPKLILAAATGIRAELVVEAGYESITVLFSPDVLISHLTGRQRVDDFRAPDGLEVLHTKEIQARELFDWGKRLADTAARHPELFNDRKETLFAAQTELLEMLLAALDSATTARHTRNEYTRQTYSRIVKLAEDYVLAHDKDRFYVTDLCVAAAASQRTMEYAFQVVMGMSPMAYMTRLRLHQVRRALRMATYGETTVSAQAVRWGFWHFGDFSSAYKDCFGELPSETLRRKPNETNSNLKVI